MTEQEKLDRLIAEKRHKQIVDGQAALSDSINKFTEAISESNKATIGAINSNGKQIGAFAEAITKILEGLKDGAPMTVTPTNRTVGTINLDITGDGETSTIVTRND